MRKPKRYICGVELFIDGQPAGIAHLFCNTRIRMFTFQKITKENYFENIGDYRILTFANPDDVRDFVFRENWRYMKGFFKEGSHDGRWTFGKVFPLKVDSSKCNYIIGDDISTERKSMASRFYPKS